MEFNLLFESYMSCLLLEARDKEYIQKLEAAGFQDAQEITDTLVSWNNPKKEKVALKWILDRTADLDEDKEKIDQAFDLIEKQHLDFQKFASPDDVLSRSDTSTERIKAKQKFDPDKEPCFTNKKALEDGVVVYQVEDSKNGQAAVRAVADIFFGHDFNGWCIIARDGDHLREDSWSHWTHYSAYPKRIAFKDGKLLSFSAGTRL